MGEVASKLIESLLMRTIFLDLLLSLLTDFLLICIMSLPSSTIPLFELKLSGVTIFSFFSAFKR